MNKHVQEISQALQLRAPQLYSLEDLAWVANNISLEKNTDLENALRKITGRYKGVTDFERDFPSLCFALATGVGKTRLMGAAIAYLYMAKKMKNFFVLAPNLTIYNKLRADFDPSSSKYVFEGITEFSTHRPRIITADDYKSGKSVRGDDILQELNSVYINIFNISKINAEVRGGKSPRIKRLSEYIGQSYFDYLAGLDDLVLLMDESHRYRAKAGMKAINELNPVLGIELTATPQVEQGTNPVPFKNVIYEYPLHKAMADGFVKEPAVATEENFNPADYDEEAMEDIKLAGGVEIHENAKRELILYAKDKKERLVKPFMLVIAKDTNHAEDLHKKIESNNFFNGDYKGCVITVHSAQTSADEERNAKLLLGVESAENPVEIVIHVNMLKEGWDVNNLYTIVPLRAAHSQTLVEQAIGRGLRLPYDGKRTGVDAVDRLTVVAHDHFDKIIKDSQESGSIFKEYIMKKGQMRQAKEPVAIRPKVEDSIAQISASICEESEASEELTHAFLESVTEIEKAQVAHHLADKDNQKELVERIHKKTHGAIDKAKITDAVKKMTPDYIKNTIDIPLVTTTARGKGNFTYDKFALETSAINYKPVSKQILIEHLTSTKRDYLPGERSTIARGKPKDFIVLALRECDDISYQDHAEVVNDLAEQAIAHLNSYLKDENKVLNVAQFHCRQIAAKINEQMQPYRTVSETTHEDSVERGFVRLDTAYASHNADEELRDFNNPVEKRNDIKGMVFSGFKKSLHPIQKFDSDSERLFVVWLEKQPEVIKWCKPAREDLKIYYFGERTYQPDFVVETSKGKLLCEVKREGDLDNEDVLAKAEAAQKWCVKATEHELYYGGRAWKYVLIPDDVNLSNISLDGLVKRYGQ